jgi:hypothetical protein
MGSQTQELRATEPAQLDLLRQQEKAPKATARVMEQHRVTKDAILAGMPRANWAVSEAMIPGVWFQLREIAERAGLSEGTTSTRIGENQRKYGIGYTKRKLSHGRGYEYKRLP